jgi:hypothetical protein
MWSYAGVREGDMHNGRPAVSDHETRQKEKEEFAYAVLKNMGIDISCGSCMSLAFTGATTYRHTCAQGAREQEQQQALDFAAKHVCLHCFTADHTTEQHDEAAKTRVQRDYAIDWSKYPKLATIFEHRPTENIYWNELRELIADQIGDALQEHLAHCSTSEK